MVLKSASTGLTRTLLSTQGALVSSLYCIRSSSSQARTATPSGSVAQASLTSSIPRRMMFVPRLFRLAQTNDVLQQTITLSAPDPMWIDGQIFKVECFDADKSTLDPNKKDDRGRRYFGRKCRISSSPGKCLAALNFDPDQKANQIKAAYTLTNVDCDQQLKAPAQIWNIRNVAYVQACKQSLGLAERLPADATTTTITTSLDRQIRPIAVLNGKQLSGKAGRLDTPPQRSPPSL